jgi:CBS domain-containing protein
MSKYQDDRDERGYYGEYERGSRTERGADRYGSDADWERGRGLRDSRDDDDYRGRAAGGGREYGRETYGRGDYTERDDYRIDDSRYGGTSSRRAREEGSLWEQGRDYVERGGRRRGASRSHLRCRDIMTRDVTVATRDTTLQEVAQMMRDEDTGVIPVVDRDDTPVAASENKLEDTPRINNRVRSNGHLVGLITDRDIVIRAVADGRDVTTTTVEEVMTTDIHTAAPNDRVIDVIRKMGDKQVRRIPVVGENGILRGIISMADVALETEEDRELADALEEISSGASFWSKIFG